MNRINLQQERNRNLGKILQLHAESIGDDPFLLSDNDRYSYAESNATVNAYANGLKKMGIEAGNRIVIYMNSCVEFVFLTLAANKLGAVWVPINTDYKGDWLAEAINDSRAAILITDTDLYPRVLEVDSKAQYPQLIVKDTGSGSMPGDSSVSTIAQLGDNPTDEPNLDFIHYGDTSAILWTSGTTGKPKGVMQSHNVWVIAAANSNKLYGTQDDDIAYNFLPLYNSASWVGNIYRTLVSGNPCALDDAFSVSSFWDRVRFYQATQTFTLGAMHMFLWNAPETPQDADNTLRVVSMVPMPDDILMPFIERFNLEGIMQGYGQSEVMLLLSKLDTRKHRWKPNALGRLSTDAELKLLDSRGEEVAPGQVGEFSIKPHAPYTIFNGYFDNPEATANAYNGEWFGTGDLGICDADGDYFFVDRKKDYIRLKGRNVSSLQVESIVMRHPAVQAAAVYGTPSDHLASEDEIKLDVILKPEQTVSAEDLAKFVNENAPYYCVPRIIEFVGELPYTPTNKLQKYKLRQKKLLDTVWDRLDSSFVIRR